jgi:hypothetical protein
MVGFDSELKGVGSNRPMARVEDPVADEDEDVVATQDVENVAQDAAEDDHDPKVWGWSIFLDVLNNSGFVI